MMLAFPSHDLSFSTSHRTITAAILHVLSDLMRSTTTLIEAIVILTVSGVCSTQADGIATLAVCAIIVVGAAGATVTWIREVYNYCRPSPEVVTEESLDNDLTGGTAPPQV